MHQALEGKRKLIGLKANIAVAGLPLSNGLGGPGLVAARDATIAAQLREAGFVFVSNQHMDEAAFGATGDNPHLGRVDNPAAPGHSPGGSSSGGAVAVALGMAASVGTDTLGSVRIPAAYCGIVGFKPSRGVMSIEGIAPLSPSMDGPGLMAGSVPALAEVFGVFLTAAHPVSRPLDACRVLVPEGVGNATPEVQAAFATGLDRMRALGWSLTFASIPGWEPEGHRRAALLLIEAEGAVVHRELVDGDDAAMSTPVRSALRFGRDAGAARVVASIQSLRRVEQGLAAALASHDLVATPTTPSPAFRWNDGPPPDQGLFTALANWSGLPAISLPLPVTARPVGLQLIGAFGQDWKLLRAAASFADRPAAQSSS